MSQRIKADSQLFYQTSATTGGLFLRGGTIFLTLLCEPPPPAFPVHPLTAVPSLIALSETTAAFSGRAVLAKHKAFSMYRPSATFLAQTIGDLPIFFVQIVIFTIIIYFMTGLKYDAGLYFAFLLFTYFVTLAMTAFFRCIGYSFGTFQNASKVSGLMFSILVTVRFSRMAARRAGLKTVRRIHHLYAVDAPLVQLDPMAQPVLLRLRG